MTAARSFHLTAADAIRDALGMLDAEDLIKGMEDGEPHVDVAPIQAALVEALELLGERP